MTVDAGARLPIVVLISGTGSNLQAIIDAAQQGTLPAEIRAVISNRPNAGGLERARLAGIPTVVLDHTEYSGREDFDAALQAAIEHFAPALVVLGGFMRILTPTFVRHFRGRLINIHPSLLPAFTGLNTHQRAIEAEVEEHGASVHFVTEELDGGPVIIQGKVPVVQGDTPQSLATRVLQVEHQIFPEAIRWFAQGRLRLVGDRAMLDGKPLPTP